MLANITNPHCRTAISWTIYALCVNPSTQAQLRAELLSIPLPFQDSTPSFEELNSFPYLDAVVRESLRLHPPVPSITRVASEDSWIPLGNEEDGDDGWRDVNRRVHDRLL